MEHQEPTHDFLYCSYTWPEPGTRRNCPFSGIPPQLNEQRPGYNGKPWTCPRCVWFFSEEELNDPDAFKGKDCPYILRQAQGRPLRLKEGGRSAVSQDKKTAEDAKGVEKIEERGEEQIRSCLACPSMTLPPLILSFSRGEKEPIS